MTEMFAVPERVKTVMTMLSRAAERGDECPSNALLATAIDATPPTASGCVSALEAMNLIRVQRTRTSRVVEIVATGQRTREMRSRPPHRDRPQIKWSEDMDASLMEHVANGRSFAATARMMGVTKDAVIGRFGRLRDKMGWQAQ